MLHGIAVRERPILMSAPMILAILDGRKVQTRRVIKLPRWAKGRDIEVNSDGMAVVFDPKAETHSCIPCPFAETVIVTPTVGFQYVPGTRLWVRETWRETEDPTGIPVVQYRAGGARVIGRNDDGIDFLCGEIDGDFERDETWLPSIFMPRWASRLTLEVTDVGVQRLQEMTMTSMDAEGTPWNPSEGLDGDRSRLEWFKKLWDKLNASRGYSWESNPFVWAVTFKVVQ